jgi:DNA invertase Pin-like site-specific DNA recombinase
MSKNILPPVQLLNTGRKRALLYLRVSTPGQVNTDFNPEGISLPAQREACIQMAAKLSADIVDEYIEPGRSATNTDARPKFQEMMARVKGKHSGLLGVVGRLTRWG